MRYASPIQTGNFVPEGKALPDNMMDYMRYVRRFQSDRNVVNGNVRCRKSEPSNMAQISVTFDVRMDDELLGMITVESSVPISY